MPSPRPLPPVARACLAILGLILPQAILVESFLGFLGLALLFITHDLAAARALADRIAVMAAGRIVEPGPAVALLGGARTPLARRLFGLSGAAPAVAIT